MKEDTLGAQAELKTRSLNGVKEWCESNKHVTPAFESLAKNIQNCMNVLTHIGKDLGHTIAVGTAPEVEESKYRRALEDVVREFEKLSGENGVVSVHVWDGQDLVKRPVTKELSDPIRVAQKLIHS